MPDTEATRSVLVTGIGGNVGQGALRVVRSVAPQLRLIGTNTTAVSPGNHLCDVVRVVPPAVSPLYPAAISRICDELRPALLLPCTDAESVVLSELAPTLPPVAASRPDVAHMFFDKWRTASAFGARGVPFARSSLPSAYDSSFGDVIVKPREGRGSRGIHIRPPDPRAFGDEYVVQELLVGEEVTIPFYVTKSGRLHGFIVLSRQLHAGTTVSCEVNTTIDRPVRALLEAMCAAFEVRGSNNVQAMLRPDGSVVPFEVNGRISGTASIRHHFGFRDVEWTLDELLFAREPSPSVIRPGSALRLLMDVIYPDLPMDAARDRSTAHRVF